MKKLLTTNLTLKLISVLVAFLLWIVVVNVSNPEITRSKSVTVEIVNDNIITEAAKTYNIVGSDTVSISYDVRTRDESKIKASDFRVYVDLTQLYDVTGSVPVSIEVVNNKDLIIGTPTARPSVIRIDTEDIQQKTFDLTTSTTGQPMEGVSVGSVSTNPGSVTVTGPVSVIGQISTMGVEIDVTDASSDMHGKTKSVYYDANGNKINMDGQDLILSPAEIEYDVIMLQGKALSISFDVSGTPGDGYQFTGAECAIKSVAVRGKSEVLDALSSIEIPSTALNVDGATTDRDVQIDVKDYLPGGVEATSDTVVTVKLKVEALNNKTIVLRQDDLNEIGHTYGYYYALAPERISVVIRGLPEDLAKLTSTDIAATIDYTHMSIGTHTGSLSFQLPNGYSVESYTPFEIVVSDEKSSQTASSSEAEETE